MICVLHAFKVLSMCAAPRYVPIKSMALSSGTVALMSQCSSSCIVCACGCVCMGIREGEYVCGKQPGTHDCVHALRGFRNAAEPGHNLRSAASSHALSACSGAPAA